MWCVSTNILSNVNYQLLHITYPTEVHCVHITYQICTNMHFIVVIWNVAWAATNAKIDCGDRAILSMRDSDLKVKTSDIAYLLSTFTRLWICTCHTPLMIMQYYEVINIQTSLPLQLFQTQFNSIHLNINLISPWNI